MTKAAKRTTIADIRARKSQAEPLVCLTAYTAPMAARLDPWCDLLLVGDSIGMALYGMDNTLQVDLEMMVRHGQAVMRRAETACVVIDMPFGTYEESPEQAYRNAAHIMRETNCDGVKLEGGQDMAPTIEYLVSRKIPVMGHIGLMPQSVLKEGGYRVKGKTAESEAEVMADARAIEEAGAFAFVLEATIEDVARRVTNSVNIPVIGIGASNACDGQILVTEDMLGLLDGHTPRFVKQYAQLGEKIEEAARAYRQDVQARQFPDAQHTYSRPRLVRKKAS